MPSPHEVVAALGGTSGEDDADKLALREAITRRMPYSLASDENGGEFTAKDPLDNTAPLYLIQDGTLYQLDPLDTTTAAGATCIVTNDNLRYKSGGIDYPWSVLDKDTTAQPTSPVPSIGDRYLIPAGATGTDWAGQDGKVGIYTAGGWRFATVPIGRLLYVEDETRYYHRDAAGTWTAGVGSFPIGDRSVTLNHVLGANASFVIKVENQTTNAPPSSPVAPVAYIIGSSPTGLWSGHAGKLAICLVDGAFTIITPVAGDVVYDKSLAAAYQFNGTVWKVESSGYAGVDDEFLEAQATINVSGLSGGSSYKFLPATGPTQSAHGKFAETLTIDLTADFAGQVFDIFYEASCEGMNFAKDSGASWAFFEVTAAIFIDDISASKDHRLLYREAVSNPSSIVSYDIPLQSVPLKLTLADTSPHTVKFMLFGAAYTSGGTALDIASGSFIKVTRRRLKALRRSAL